jgi:superfamily I DNA/RNA helicase
VAGRPRTRTALVRTAPGSRHAEARRADLIQLEQIASGYPSRERFLTELTLDPPDATSDQAGVPLLDEDYLILSTIHSAKGQEWKSVFVLNVVDGCMPSDLGAGTSAELEEAPPLRRDDAGERRSPPNHPATVLHARSKR